VLTIAGAGMAGLAAAARARELGLDVRLLEKGTRAGGSMLLSSCVIWRYRSLEDFREECPGGDPALQAQVIERLDDAVQWLVSLGAPVVWEETGNPRTVGKRFDPQGLTDALLRAAGVEPSFGTSATAETESPLLLATGGFQGSERLVERYVRPASTLRLRANPWSEGDALELALVRGAAVSAGMDEFYGRNMPDTGFREGDFVRLAQLYGRYATVVNRDGQEFFEGPVSWSENDLVQATARQPGAKAWYLLDEAALGQRVRDRTVAELAAASGTSSTPDLLPFEAPGGTKLAVRVSPGITHTIGGLRIDPQARVVDADGAAIDGLYAAGADAGGISTGGYASGLAAALVFGGIAAESVAG
jgi:succinate dehydrogenase/fumarate reductase flavoprotein subunit